MSGKRGQRGSLRIESGSYYGYFNVYVWDESRNDSIRKQKCVKLGLAEGPAKLSKWDASEKLRLEIEKAQGTSTDKTVGDSNITFEKFAESRWKPLKESKWRPSSKHSAEHTLKQIYAAFGSTALKNIDKIALQNWLNKLATTHSKSLVLHSKFYLKSILEEAVDQDYLVKNPAKKLETPRTKRVAKDTLTVEQFKQVLAELESPYDLIVKVGVASALRPSELLALRWRDLDVKAKTFTIRETIYRGKLRPYTKTTQEGETDKALLTVPVPDELITDLLAYRGTEERHRKRFRIVSLTPKVVTDFFVEDKDFIFHNLENGNPIVSENILFRIFDPIEKKLGLKLNFQVLRRTAATLAQHSGSVKDIQGLLRHRSPDISMEEYAQVIPESTRAMVNTMYAGLTKTADEAGK